MKKFITFVTFLVSLSVIMSCTKKSTEKQILSFKFVSPEVEGLINEESKTITATMPYNADFTSLAPTIVVSENAIVDPGSGIEVDFSDPVNYTVTAEDGSRSNYTAIVTSATILGKWGVEKLIYYETDYLGEPQPLTLQTYEFTPGDLEDGIDMLFRADGTGEKIDRSRDTIYEWNPETHTTDIIVCPDTTIVLTHNYTCNYADSQVYLNREDGLEFILNILELTAESFVCKCEYNNRMFEEAYLVKLSDTPVQSGKKKPQQRPYIKGSLLSSPIKK